MFVEHLKVVQEKQWRCVRMQTALAVPEGLAVPLQNGSFTFYWPLALLLSQMTHRPLYRKSFHSTGTGTNR